MSSGKDGFRSVSVPSRTLVVIIFNNLRGREEIAEQLHEKQSIHPSCGTCPDTAFDKNVLC
jgi:hypothetical protein